MQIFATFEYSGLLEIAVSELKVHGVNDIYAVPLDVRREAPRAIDSLHRADGMSFVDKGFILAFMFATIGASKGFVWAWGPVICGLIGAAFGLLLGLFINWCLYLYKSRKMRIDVATGKRKGDVILIVTCEEGQAEMVKDILWDHAATGLAMTR